MEKSNNTNGPYSLKKIFSGASMYSLGDVLVGASNFLLIPIFTRILSPSDYGVLGYLQVFSQVFVVLLGFGFHGAQTRYYYEHRSSEELVGKFMFTTNLTTIVAFLVFCTPIVFLASIYQWKIGSERIAFHPFFSITLLSVFFSIFNNYILTSLRMRQKFLSATLLRVFIFLISTCFTLLLVVRYRKGAIGQIAGNALGYGSVFVLFYFLYAKKNFKFEFSKDALKYASAFGFPVVLHLLMNTMHNSIDRLMLEKYLPISALGIYTLGISVATALQIFITAFNQAYQPSYYELMETGGASKAKLIIVTFKFWLCFLTIATCLGIVIGGPFLAYYAGPEFIEVSTIFPYLLLSVYSGSYYYFFSSPIFFYKKTNMLPVITGSSAIINIIMNLLLIPKFGVIGAAIATIISHIWISLIAYIVGNKLFKIRWPISWIFSSIILIVLSFFLQIIINI